MSMFDLSTSIFIPPAELTVSTQYTISSYFLITSPISLIGLAIPVEVSL